MEKNGLVKKRSFWLGDSDFKGLKEKAYGMGYSGKGFVSKFIRKIIHSKIILLETSNEEVEVSIKVRSSSS